MGRRSVWSDQQVRELLGRFVLATDEVWRLQGGWNPRTYREAGGDDPECCSFQEMAGAGHYGAGAGTKQGIYVCTSGGAFLASVNSTNPARVAAMMTRGLQAFEALPEPRRAPAPTNSVPSHRWEWSYPRDGLVLAQTFRYLPTRPTNRRGSFNQDHVWFSPDETKQFLPDDPRPGLEVLLPEVLLHRFARHHLLNSARGESGPFSAAEVEGELRATVLTVRDRRVRLMLRGRSTARSDNPKDRWRPTRIDAQMFGFAEFDRHKRRVLSFDLAARGTVTLTPRGKEEQATTRSIGWLFELADTNKPSARIAPTHLHAYGVPWVTKPKVRLGALPRRPMKNTDSRKSGR